MELTDPKQIKAALHPLRQRLVRALDGGPATPSELARKIGIAASKAHYHVGVLEKAGMVRLVETRTVGSVTEKYYELAARDFELRLKGAPDQMDQTTAIINAELAALMEDFKAALQTPDLQERCLHLSLQRLSIDEETVGSVKINIDRLQSAVETAVAKRRGREYRLVLAWIPMKTEETEC